MISAAIRLRECTQAAVQYTRTCARRPRQERPPAASGATGAAVDKLENSGRVRPHDTAWAERHWQEDRDSAKAIGHLGASEQRRYKHTHGRHRIARSVVGWSCSAGSPLANRPASPGFRPRPLQPSLTPSRATCCRTKRGPAHMRWGLKLWWLPPPQAASSALTLSFSCNPLGRVRQTPIATGQ